MLVYTLFLITVWYHPTELKVQRRNTNLTSQSLINKTIIGEACNETEYYPFVVYLSQDPTQLCGGTLLNHVWVLTAATCETDEKIVIAGRDTPGEQRRTTIRIILHPKFNFTLSAIENNIALARLDSPITESRYIKYVDIPVEPIIEEIKEYCPEAMLIGWGRFQRNVPKWSENLQCKNIEVSSVAKCQNHVRSPWIRATAICSFPRDDQDIFIGNTGGALICKDKRHQQLGVIGRRVFTNTWSLYLYARVDMYLDFIEKALLNADFQSDHANKIHYFLVMIFLPYIIVNLFEI